MSTELYKKHRPRKFSEMIGQDVVVRMLLKKVKTKTLPHTILLHGPSGCGKTTIARILRTNLRCSSQDFVEVNCADFRGIDMVRDIRSRMVLSPIGGETRVWLIDEAHQLSSQAQNAFLKMLEDTPEHVYFILATTDPQKLINTIRTRCMEVGLRGLSGPQIQSLLTSIGEAEGISVPEAVADRIVDAAGGSPRKALVLLDSVRSVTGEEHQLALLASADSERQAIELARLLIKPRVTWAEVAKAIKQIEEEPETLRWMILGYATSIVLGGGKLASLGALIIQAFRDNFYDSKKAGLTIACWEVVEGAKG
jgi:DNA polymerase III gamma/tau subunit